MKHYKHKITGKIVKSTNDSSVYENEAGGKIQVCYLTKDYGWEEMEPPSYQILSFKGPHKHLWNLLPNGKFQQGYNTPSTLEWMLSLCKEEKNQFQIWSVKRLSDNEILTVGKDMSFQGFEVKNGVLSKITIRPYEPFDLRMWANYTYDYASAYSIDRLSPREKLFTTEDGKNIYPGDTYAFICNNIISEIKATQGKYTFIENYYWSTKEKALAFLKTQILFTTDDGVQIFKRSNTPIFTISKEYNFSMAQYVIDNITYYYLPDRNWYFHSKEKASAFIQSQKPKPLFVTEDGVQIFIGHVYWVLWTDKFQGKDFHWKTSHTSEVGKSNLNYNQQGNKERGVLWFSTKEKAEEYIYYNKPCLSINDVATIYVTANRKAQPVVVHGKKLMKMGKQPEALLNLVKKKLG